MRIRRTSTTRPRLTWPWVHWCAFDVACRDLDIGSRIYIHPLRLWVEWGKERESTMTRLYRGAR